MISNFFFVFEQRTPIYSKRDVYIPYIFLVCNIICHNFENIFMCEFLRSNLCPCFLNSYCICLIPFLVVRVNFTFLTGIIIFTFSTVLYVHFQTFYTGIFFFASAHVYIILVAQYYKVKQFTSSVTKHNIFH